jgi:hypothetical protein
MSHDEADVPCEEELQSKFCMLRNILLRAESDRAMALARLQTVQTELNIKRALKPGVPRPGC